ncbi:MAG: SgcJ/EcaC family oxidoreductase [Anaerolineales bacterium]|nr:SgcJ/EcaC family oxidoreductase [Anaerolineales bacterium]MCA9974726.1 SgcJ/EcaC family oxidoreductase [Anaerolineales bacterium]
MAKRDYMAYLLRLWREKSDSPWRALLENPHSGERAAFATLPELVTFLVDMTGYNKEFMMHDQTMSKEETAVTLADEQAVKDVIQALVTAWNNGDSDAWSQNVTEDIRHTVWNGHHVFGREALTAGHTHLFNTVYKGTRQVFNIRWIRFLRPDVAAAQWDAQLEGVDDTPKVRPLAILVKQQDRWLINIFQNTPILNGRATTNQ